MRITGTEWENNGINENEATIFAKELEKIWCHYVCFSSGGNTHNPKIPWGPNYQVHLAIKNKKNTKMIVRTVGMITDPVYTIFIINRDADVVAMVRAFFI